jgi:hypothetical protein
MSNIFAKPDNVNIIKVKNDSDQTEIENRQILTEQGIINSIPSGSCDYPDPILRITKIEWRWRFFNINGRKMVEISKKKKDEPRIYVDQKGMWIRSDIGSDWDQFVVREQYYYAD